MRLRNTLISLTLAAITSLPVFAASSPATYDATYKILRKGKALGVGTRSLSWVGDHYELKNASDLRWLIFTDQRQEASTFTVEDGQILASHYEYSRSGTGPDESDVLDFDGNTVKSGGAGIEVQGTVFDPLSYQQQLALDLAAGKDKVNYRVVKELKEKEYRFEVVGEERISTPLGELDTLRVERDRGEGSSRQTIFWLAPSLDYTLVRLWQAKDGVEQMELVISDYQRAKADTTTP
ncbi:DUF3108 domain-containing protein [Gallaecimonas xiamenensis]|uniref:DUF3108 domain-containing protein n=1 Tax=Gallaecimonas xiamenensis 3-C-1 TaxID=745411 RepID=K2K0E0_9GAMM|nr:DUF3108 domain-containing protein [Gallaecimonas xiamenensis]EKE76169.1 hypothetical protein B3C1_04655 [Gallaecimonas xiamenensis 3-C-1]